jgi:flagellar hook assembly protein FlgD
VTGRLVKQYNNKTIQQSNHITWDGTDERGRRVCEGIYFIRFTTTSIDAIYATQTEKVVLLK